MIRAPQSPHFSLTQCERLSSEGFRSSPNWKIQDLFTIPRSEGADLQCFAQNSTVTTYEIVFLMRLHARKSSEGAAEAYSRPCGQVRWFTMRVVLRNGAMEKTSAIFESRWRQQVVGLG
jgi:hypothetical protein